MSLRADSLKIILRDFRIRSQRWHGCEDQEAKAQEQCPELFSSQHIYSHFHLSQLGAFAPSVWFRWPEKIRRCARDPGAYELCVPWLRSRRFVFITRTYD